MTLRSLLRWAQTEYRREAPQKLHSGRELAEDGDPKMSGEAEGYLGLGWPQRANRDAALAARIEAAEDDWMAVSHRLDPDGYYVTPLRATIARIGKGNPELARFLHDLVSDTFYPSDVCAVHGVPAWCRDMAVGGCLALLRRSYRTQPEVRARGPKWTELSESQQKAMDAA